MVCCGVLLCFHGVFPGNTHTKHQISQAQLKAEKETSAKALAECEKLKAQVRPKLDDELIVGSSKMHVEEYLLVNKCQW